MGDGNVYGWHRRGVPIPHTVLIAFVLFVFGRALGIPRPPLRARHPCGVAGVFCFSSSPHSPLERHLSFSPRTIFTRTRASCVSIHGDTVVPSIHLFPKPREEKKNFKKRKTGRHTSAGQVQPKETAMKLEYVLGVRESNAELLLFLLLMPTSVPYSTVASRPLPRNNSRLVATPGAGPCPRERCRWVKM